MSDKSMFKKSSGKKAKTNDDARYELADRVMGAGGYAGDKQAESGERKPRRTSSYSATDADRERLNRLQGELQSTGHKVTLSDVISTALVALDELSREEKLRVHAEANR